MEKKGKQLMSAEDRKTINIISIVDSVLGSKTNQSVSLQMNQIMVFQGDSITDSGRNRKNTLPNSNSSLGDGFVFEVSKTLNYAIDKYNLNIYNRGVAGNKTDELLARWSQDCVSLKPDILTILIGVNDYWHKKKKNQKQSLEDYSRNYEHLISDTKHILPNTCLILCEPFILPNTGVVDDSWLEPFSNYRRVAETIAINNDAMWIPLQKVFTEAVKYAPEAYWLYDGVHPTKAGVKLISYTWLHCLSLT